MKKLTYFVIAVALLAGGCKEDNGTTGNIKGTVFNASMEPLLGIRVDVAVYLFDIGDQWTTWQSCVTGADGRYEFVGRRSIFLSLLYPSEC